MQSLIVSRKFMVGKGASKKAPGVNLAEKLERLKVFNLLDVPSNFNGMGFIDSLKTLFFSTKKIIIYSLSRDNDHEFFFYNFPKAYIYFYLIIKILGGKISLFMADGENCVGLKRFPKLFIKLFSRVVHLHFFGKDQFKLMNKSAYWFPGVLAAQEIASFNLLSTRPAVILYNSSIKDSNDPYLLLKIVNENKSIQFYCTSNIGDFNAVNFNILTPLPKNIRFVGELNFGEYQMLLDKVDGVLLIRNEKKFENRYNFPSKLIEAICHRKTVFSIYEISGVPGNLYINCQSSFDLNSALSVHFKTLQIGDSTQFKEACDVNNLVSWLNL